MIILSKAFAAFSAFFITISFAVAGPISPDDVEFVDGAVLACHVNSEMSDQTFHGEVGPILDGVAQRWEEHELRGMLVNSKMMFDGTIMPAFYRESGFERNLKKFEGKTILSAQQVEDVLAYLLTLTEE